jgi:hypothetical protein
MELHPRQFLRTWLVSAVTMLLFVGAYDAVIDPYMLIAMPRVPRVNSLKTAVDTQQHLIKSYDVLRAVPHTLVLGSSQVALGMDAQYSASLAHAIPGYNLGIAHGGVYEAYRYLQHVTSSVDVRLVVLGIEFRDFLGPQDQRHPEFESRLAVRSDGSRNPTIILQHTRDIAWSLFSLQAFSDSLLTVERNLTGNSSYFTAGYWDYRGFRPGGEWFGSAPFFVGVDLSFAREFPRAKVDPQVMRDMANILNLCQSRGVRLIIVLNPSYADELEMLHLTRQWNVFEDWKRNLVSLVAGYTAPSNRVEIWDFCDYSTYVTEAVPEKSQPMRWFLNPVHYSRELGNLMLERIFGRNDSPFGVLLTPENLNAHLAEIRAERLRYLAGNTPDVKRVQNAFNLALGIQAVNGN